MESHKQEEILTYQIVMEIGYSSALEFGGVCMSQIPPEWMELVRAISLGWQAMQVDREPGDLYGRRQ
jgi:hypothetical protein